MNCHQPLGHLVTDDRQVRPPLALKARSTGDGRSIQPCRKNITLKLLTATGTYMVHRITLVWIALRVTGLTWQTLIWNGEIMTIINPLTADFNTPTWQLRLLAEYISQCREICVLIKDKDNPIQQPITGSDASLKMDTIKEKQHWQHVLNTVPNEAVESTLYIVSLAGGEGRVGLPLNHSTAFFSQYTVSERQGRTERSRKWNETSRSPPWHNNVHSMNLPESKI